MGSPVRNDTDRETAVAAYVAGGSYEAASRTTGIPSATIRAWKRRDPTWWDEVAERCRIEYSALHEAKIRDTMVLSLTELEDRVRNGDYVMGKDGELSRIPVKARDLVIAAGTMFDKLRLVLGQPTSYTGKADGTSQDKLAALREAARGPSAPVGATAKTPEPAQPTAH